MTEHDADDVRQIAEDLSAMKIFDERMYDAVGQVAVLCEDSPGMTREMLIERFTEQLPEHEGDWTETRKLFDWIAANIDEVLRKALEEKQVTEVSPGVYKSPSRWIKF